MDEGNRRASGRASLAHVRHAAALPHGSAEAADALGAVVRMSPLAMVLTDPGAADCPVIFCNRAFTRLTGYAEEEVIGRNCRFLQGTDSDPAAIRALGEAFRANKEIQVDLWNYRKDGSRFWNSMFLGPVYDAQGRLLYYFGSQTDSSSRRAAEDAADRERRMDALGSMAAGLAHEINNLMTVVMGNAEVLRKTVSSDKGTERLGHIERAADAAGTLTRQMLSIAGKQGHRAEMVDLNDVLRGLDHRLGQVALSACDVELAFHPAPLFAVVDGGQLELALLNLVKNAADASPPHASISVAAVAMLESGMPVAEISVKDHGSGMFPEVAAKALDPFFTTKEHGKSTGLGLSMVAGFCQESGGRMSIQTEAGRGTTVRLLFPLLNRDCWSGDRAG